MLLESGRHFDILTEYAFQKRAQEYRVAVLADTACVEAETVDTIGAFVEAGGVVIASGFVSLFGIDGQPRDELALADVLGVDYKAESEFSVHYLYDRDEAIGQDVPDMPILVQRSGSRALRVSPREGAEVMASLVEPPFEASPDRHVYHQHAHPARRSGCPSIVRNRKGRGRSLYFSQRIFSSYFETGSPWLRQVFINSLDQVSGQAKLVVDHASSVHVSLMRQGDRYVIHLVNVSDAKFDVSRTFMTRMVPACNVKVKLRVKAGSVASIPDMRPLDFVRTDQGIEFVVSLIDVHKAFVLEAAEME
jgi:hypothetical protein